MRHAVLLLALVPTFACASVIQPGFADPGGVHAPEAGSVTVAVQSASPASARAAPSASPSSSTMASASAARPLAAAAR